MKKLLSTLLLLSIYSIHASEWQVNWQHSKVGFEVNYMGVSSVEGTFNKYEGAFSYDLETKKLENVDIYISTKSIDTDNDKRDSHLKKKDFFNISKFPRITFKSKKTIYEKNRPIKLIGDLTIKGITKEIELDMKEKGVVKDPWDKEKLTLFMEAKSQIKRSDFGLTWNKTLDNGGMLIGEDVILHINIEAFKVGVRPAFSRFYLPIKDIKKEVLNEVIDDSTKTESIPLKKKVVESSITQERNSAKGVAYNIVFGFFLFIAMILISIKLQMLMTKKLEKMNASDNITFIIPNLIIIVLLTIVATKLAPYMGYGVHPWE